MHNLSAKMEKMTVAAPGALVGPAHSGLGYRVCRVKKRPASTMSTDKPCSASTLVVIPPPAPEPTMTAS